MPTKPLPDIDWSSIRPLNGSKQDAFEELCTQLARASCLPGSKFTRKGRPDSGVEAYAENPDGTEWAWQAKYVDSMTGRWSQLDTSVKAALNGHPKLVRFVACVPTDLADGRVKGSTTARQQWDQHVRKWSGWAARRGMTVQFDWLGNHEMLTELAKPQSSHLLSFFFGDRHLDDEWFRARLQEAHTAASARYTPELNVDVPIHAYFEALGRTRSFFNGVRAKAPAISDRIRSKPFQLIKEPTTGLKEKIEAAGAACDSVLSEFRLLTEDAVDPDPLGALREALRGALRSVADVMSEHAEQAAARKLASGPADGALSGPREHDYATYVLRELYEDLSAAKRHVEQYRGVVNSNLVVLTGDAGTGKTHLLCDLAKQRLALGLPTVVLMGQRYLEVSEPWTQTLQQLDLAGWSSSDLVKALEIVAQAAGHRVLFVIDAINEGAGRQIWPVHLAAYLERLSRSRWISTVVSVRTTYADEVLPVSVSESATWIHHSGFQGVEFEATRAFFELFNIELPSSPLLAPEFSNPLYLKTLCQGLKASGQRRLPRGFHGVVKAFANYVLSVNNTAASNLDYDPRSNLVDRALTDLAGRMVDTQKPWVDYDEAGAIVDAHLPGRSYSKSLMAKLLREGVLIQERAWSEADGTMVETIQIAYERLSDYRCVEVLLDRHLDVAAPGLAFEPGGMLAPEVLSGNLGRAGFHEALHILVAERTGQELVDLAPTLADDYITLDAFLKSLMWRDPKAVTTRAIDYLLTLRGLHEVEVVETLVTLATIPHHPLNAVFTDGLLREAPMPDRDAWWTIGLHKLWQQNNAIDRLFVWADQVWPHVEVSDDSGYLAASILAWMLPSSNRFLRDQATKALVRVLTWRPKVVGRLIEQFVDIDDAYVAERVLAAAYGAAMRTIDGPGVSAVADQVHAKVFASGRPRPHLLMREYAQGIIKRAQFLVGVSVLERWPNIDPPYASDWPTVPTQAQVDVIAPGWTSNSSDDFSWGHRRIRNSVMDDDFGRYVIGTNSGATNWLAVRLDEPPWEPVDLRVDRAVATLSASERKAWRAFEKAATAASMSAFMRDVAASAVSGASDPSAGNADPALEQKRNDFLEAVGDHRRGVFVPLMDALSADRHTRQPPKFDLGLIQRYVVARVFELGWTSDRFNEFDSNLERRGREAAKPERIGKKYQWIAYHEMLAFMADHYQYIAGSRFEQVGAAYQGSWQDDVRDIDPSNVMQALEEETEDGAVPAPEAFWAPAQLESWHREVEPGPWAQITSDIPLPTDLLFSRDGRSFSQWVTLATDLKWSMPRPAYQDTFRDGRREIWMNVDGALINRGDASEHALKKLARAAAHRGTHGGGLHEIFLGEFGWSQASKFFDDPYYAHQGWASEANPDVISGTAVAQRYVRERGGFDGSVTLSTVSLQVPTDRMLELMQAHWSGISATYVDKDGTVVMFDPSPNAPGPSALLVRMEAIQELLKANALAVCWVIQGEKIDQQGSPDYGVNARRSFHGAFSWDGETLTGSYEFEKVELP